MDFEHEWAKLDINRDGVLEKSEFETLTKKFFTQKLKDSGVPESFMTHLLEEKWLDFLAMDTNHDDKI